jgi:alpha-tubulin suppressor-like RCC1 family protein
MRNKHIDPIKLIIARRAILFFMLFLSASFASTLTAAFAASSANVSKIGIYADGTWYLDLNGNGAWDGTPTDAQYSFRSGIANEIPVTGDWTGTGIMKIGVYANGTWYLDLNGNGVGDGTPTDAQYSFGGGVANAIPITGDWIGTGITKIGVYANGTWYLDLNGNGVWDGTPTDAQYSFGSGIANAIPVTGDWTGTGTTRIGVYANGTWYLDLNGNGVWDGTPTDAQYSFGGGVANAIPVTGDWTGTGITKIGVYANGTWYLDLNGNGVWDGTPTDAQYFFGNGVAGAVPLTGNWNTYTITASAGPNGTISPSGIVSVISGATVTFTVTPNTGYHVSDVLVDGASVGTLITYMFTNVTANYTITASFAADDITPPTGSIVINNGAAFTNTTTVILTLSAADSGSGLSQMQFSNDGSTWSTPEAYATSKSWMLTNGDGTKTVYIKFKDNANNWSNSIASNTITLDTTPPFVTITSPATGFINNKTPLLSYAVSDGTVVVKLDGVAVSKVSGNTLDAIADGTHTVRVESTDAAGNTGSSQVTFTIDSMPPLVLTKMPKLKVIAAGDDHSLAIAIDGSLWAWGANSSGNLGDGTIVQSSSPERIGTETTWTTIAVGYDASLAIKSGTLWVWGYNGYGQLGDGTIDDKHAPVQIGTDNNWKSISMKGYHALALKQNGTLWAWGANWDGEVGDGSTDDKHAPVQIGIDTNWSVISAGFYHNLALKSDGTLWAWGANWFGQLGDGTTDDKHAPVQIGTDTNWIMVDEGDGASFALKSDGTLWAWGNNQGGWYGLLGMGPLMIIMLRFRSVLIIIGLRSLRREKENMFLL